MTHPTDDSLKPCPFCGGAAKVSVMRDESIWSHEIVPYTKVECGDCGIGTDYLCEGWEPTAQEAWNTRALLAEQARPTQVMQEARETLLIAAANFGGVAPSARDRCIRAANALHEVYTAQPLKAEQAKDAADDAPSDQVIELAGALEVRRILEAIKEVANLRPANDKITFDAAWQLCCEEIFYRATGCRWHMDEDAERFSRAARAAEGKA